MTEQRLENLLKKLGKQATEPVSGDLAEKIKDQIPSGFVPHHKSFDTIKIMIDLRVNRLTAAAAIIITTVLCASFLGGRPSTVKGVLRDAKMMARFFLIDKEAGDAEMSPAKAEYERLVRTGKDVVYYGLTKRGADANSAVMHWKVSADEYKVMFADMHTEVVTAEELIRLQWRMLQVNSQNGKK